jgi:hypothetical protein
MYSTMDFEMASQRKLEILTGMTKCNLAADGASRSPAKARVKAGMFKRSTTYARYLLTSLASVAFVASMN